MFPSIDEKNISNRCLKNVPHVASNGTYNNSMKANDLKARWEGMLRRYDSDGDGRLSKRELEDAFRQAGSSMPRWRAYRALCHADKNGDGFIDEAELPGLLQYAAKKGYVL